MVYNPEYIVIGVFLIAFIFFIMALPDVEPKEYDKDDRENRLWVFVLWTYLGAGI